MPLNGGSGKKVDFMGFSGDSELPFNQVVGGSNPPCLTVNEVVVVIRCKPMKMLMGIFLP